MELRPQVQVTASTETSVKPDRSSPSSTLASRLESPALAARLLLERQYSYRQDNGVSKYDAC